MLLVVPLFLAFLGFITPGASSSIDQSERDTLFSVMYSMSSDKDWRAYSPDPCDEGSSWPGLECKPGPDDHLHVTKLVFGTPPNPTCSRSSSFPAEIFQLPFLQSVHFLNCFKWKKTALSFPPHSQNFALQQLSLRANPALFGTIPPQVSSLRSLQVLTLSQNRLYGKIPESISSLTSMIHLDLSYNSLTGRIPAQMGSLSSLVHLDLSYNSLFGTIPPSIGQMGMLQKLDLSSNSLIGSIPQSIESLKWLTFLALSNNRLSGYPHPASGLTNLQSLQYLIMESNPIYAPLPPELGTLPKLQELRLANSSYSGAIPESFSGLKNLTTLSLENNRLSGAIPPGLGRLGSIYHLNLSRNMLDGVVPFSSVFIMRLGRNLDLSGNPKLCLSESDSFKGVEDISVPICASATSSSSSSPLMQRQPLQSSLSSSSSLESGVPYWQFSSMTFIVLHHFLRLL
ncbi:hypothetical protein HPP92_024054 [Vanilla planifolia]|uniref:Uncharacterized protein n=1 Tax=Vanilla planifolia TaxID=51239 RepID=A0A835UEB9_VANPL|nr:hypothetical protein HPP92_024445 [Vanilla planifolia]KAG0456266.1 hypothetical protein HPP92_024054 [Vanilla planifolia]